MPPEIQKNEDGLELLLWRCHDWGTKWNACHTNVVFSESSEGIRLYFDTAWSVPWPILEELRVRFPLLTMEGDVLEK
jgi:hypothetical protein